MSPICPEEVDVFTIPHTRMKELVEQYLDMLTSTNFADAVMLTNLLENLCKTFREFIAHEQIENRYIMTKLKHKLHSLSIENNAVCNCHKDNQLTDMLDLLHDGYRCTKKSDADRSNYGLKLRQALESFTQTFIPHMEEEEEVFQPLLMQHFTVEELKQIKAKVIEQHFKIEGDESPEKFVHDNKSSKLGKSKNVATPSEFDKLPDEVVMKIFSDLTPRDLCRASQVSNRWHRLAMDGSLWTQLFPVSWAKGNWAAREGVYEEDTEESVEKKLEGKVHDEDADVDESELCDDWDAEAEQIQWQSGMLTAMCKHLLPQVGQSVRHCDLAYSKGLTNGALYKILSLCPNLEYLDVTQTRISDLGFKGLQKSGCGQKLRHVDLTGCLHITDKTLERLANATLCNINDLGCTRPPSHKSESHNNEQATKADKKTMKPEERRLGDEENVKKLEEKIIGEEKKIEKNNAENEQRCKENAKEVDNDFNVSREVAVNEVCDTERSSQGEESQAKLQQDSTGLEDALSRLRCCHSNKGCCCGQTDIETSQTAWKCCRKGGKGLCATCPWRKGQQGKRSRTNNDDLLPNPGNIVQCQGRIAKEGDRSRTTFNDRPPSDCKGSPQETEGNRSRTFNNDRPPADSGRSAPGRGEGQSSGDTVGGEKPKLPDETIKPGRQAESTTGPPKEIMVQVVPDPPDSVVVVPDPRNLVNEDVQPESWQIPGLTFIPELYILPQDERLVVVSDLDLDDNSGTKTLECAMNNKDNHGDEGEPVAGGRRLQYLSLSGCYQITDLGLQYLTDCGGLPRLQHLDLSGCLELGGEAVSRLVSTATSLEPATLFYCDNIVDGPYLDQASGCQNLQCNTRVCCRAGE